MASATKAGPAHPPRKVLLKSKKCNAGVEWKPPSANKRQGKDKMAKSFAQRDRAVLMRATVSKSLDAHKAKGKKAATKGKKAAAKGKAAATPTTAKSKAKAAIPALPRQPSAQRRLPKPRKPATTTAKHIAALSG